MTTLGAIRPDAWNLPLLLHVLGAMLVVGTLSLAAFLLLAGGRNGEAVLQRRLGFRTLWIGVLPSYLLMRIAAQWVYSREGYGNGEDPAWIGIGYITTDIGALLLLIALIVGGVGVRRLRSDAPRLGFTTAAGVLSALLLAAFLVAVWAMTAKPD